MSLFDEIKCEDLLNNFPIKESAKSKKKKKQKHIGQRTAGHVEMLKVYELREY